MADLDAFYPPLVNDFMPAFSISDNAKINFSISPYNTETEIKRIHVSLVNQYTNIKAIKNSPTSDNDKYFDIINGIWISSWDIDKNKFLTYDKDLGIYTLSIPPIILKDESFMVDGYYKVQLRFDKSTASIRDSSGEHIQGKYLTEERYNFSEWSSVCLLKAIPEVKITLTNFEQKIDSKIETESGVPSFNPGIVPIVGDVDFINQLPSPQAETLRSYEITIYDKEDPSEILDDSGVIFTGDQVDLNHIYWLAGLENAVPGHTYVANVSITTKNQYTTSKDYEFEIFQYSSEPFNVTWNFSKVRLNRYNVTTDDKIITEEDGIVKCILDVNSSVEPGYLYIKRASSRDNFKKWELIKCVKVVAGPVSVEFNDMTVGSLVQYKYIAQYQIARTGMLTKIVQSPKSDIIYPDFYDILLSRQGRQLAIRYDAQITGLKPVVNRQKIDTLGGKYPKFAENAQMNYKEFSISGLIDAESDFNRKFLDDTSSKYRDAMDVYNSEQDGKYILRNDTIPVPENPSKTSEDNAYPGTTDERKIRARMDHNTDPDGYYASVHDIYPMDNWWWEREFREEALKWLNDGEPKLFRTMTEGNIAVILTDISLTPHQATNRRLYQFTASAHEVGDGYSLDSLNSLGIVNIVNEKESTTATEPIENTAITHYTIGQIYSQNFNDPDDSGKSWILEPGGSIVPMWGDKKKNTVGLDSYHINIKEAYKEIYYEADSRSGKQSIIVPDSFVLTELQIEFESEPTLWDLTSTKENKTNEDGSTIQVTKSQINPITINDIDKIGQTGENKFEPRNPVLGYKIALQVEGTTVQSANSGSGKQYKEIEVFVNEKGFYQVPSNLRVVGVYIYGNAKATLNYHLEYKTRQNTLSKSKAIKIQGEVIGQIYGSWTPETHMSDLIAQKHKWSKINEKGQTVRTDSLQDWSALNLEVTPYAVFSMKFEEDLYNHYVVGRTGIYNLSESDPIEELYFLGRRMVLAADSRQDYLDEWEFILDDSARIDKDKVSLKNKALTWEQFLDGQYRLTEQLVEINGAYTNKDIEGINRYWNSSKSKRLPAFVGYEKYSQIPNPKYNTVYGIQENGEVVYKIYYIDGYWYDVEFADDAQTIALAKVPITGMLNYKGTIITETFE